MQTCTTLGLAFQALRIWFVTNTYFQKVQVTLVLGAHVAPGDDLLDDHGDEDGEQGEPGEDDHGPLLVIPGHCLRPRPPCSLMITAR